jgi:hypothetical protein
MKKFGLVLFASALLAGPALAEQPYSATLAKPLTTAQEVLVFGTIFDCNGSACVTASQPADAGLVRTCRALAAKVGPLTAYGSASKPFDADKLAQCNTAG